MYYTNRRTSVKNVGNKKGGKSGLGKNDTYGQSGSIKQTHRHDTCYSSYMQKMCRLAGKHLGNNRNVALLKKFIT